MIETKDNKKHRRTETKCKSKQYILCTKSVCNLAINNLHIVKVIVKS